MRIICLVLILFLIGCSEFKKPVRDVDPELEVYVSDFEKRFNIAVNYSVKLASLPGTTIGMCYGFKSSFPSVEIDIEFFNANKHVFIIIQHLIYHELGHCSLRLDHDHSFLENGYPSSIMFPSFFGGFTYYRNNIEYYFNELESKWMN